MITAIKCVRRVFAAMMIIVMEFYRINTIHMLIAITEIETFKLVTFTLLNATGFFGLKTQRRNLSVKFTS